MRIALHLLGLSEDDIAEIRTALGMLSEVYYQTYQRAKNEAFPPPYFHYSFERAERCEELRKLFLG